MILDRVTVTGADDSIKPEDLIPLSKRFPFVEWGILLSKSQEGSARFPTLSWMQHLLEVQESLGDEKMALSGHLCGRWVRDVCAGNWTFVNDRPTICHMFPRIQLNFHAQIHTIDRQAFFEGYKKAAGGPGQLIFQMDNVNNSLLKQARTIDINAVALFDLSGGAGILPNSWPKPECCYTGECYYTGYAGGLSPDNVAEQIEKIKLVAPGEQRIWIDCERRVRSEDDSKFDLEKVARFLENAEPYVTKAKTETK
jgi:phosphoribosylanthranilate isomerase